MNEKLLQKLQSRNETLEEREERRGNKRAEKIASTFGYTAEDNPFRDPNLHQPFEWKKKSDLGKVSVSRKDKLNEVFGEIEKVRQRRKERDLEHEEYERRKAEQSRLKEQENYEEYEKKEEEFHLIQQRQRSAIRLVQGREKPIDVLAKNLLMFGVKDESESIMSVKYKEKYNVWNDLNNLEVELQPPHVILHDLKLDELNQLLHDVTTFLNLEQEASHTTNELVLQYWNALLVVTKDEIYQLQSTKTTTPAVISEIETLFQNNSLKTLKQMKDEVLAKLSSNNNDITTDVEYWKNVLNSLNVHLAKAQLLDMHSKMLVHQLELLEKRKKEFKSSDVPEKQEENVNLPQGITSPEFGNEVEDLGLTNEIQLTTPKEDTNHKKPRYFNRVKTGYDWNKYNQTHYDHDNPPPKTVQGYKFNIFYPDLLDKTKTPQYTLEPTNSPDFCIIKFTAGPPYEDVAFKTINREWNKSRKRGFKCTFERGILSLYFNFMNYHYRK